MKSSIALVAVAFILGILTIVSSIQFTRHQMENRELAHKRTALCKPLTNC